MARAHRAATAAASACLRWGDYSGMALDPNGCAFWMTDEYLATSGLNTLTRIGSFAYPSCTTIGNGTLSGTVTDGSSPIAGATVRLGSEDSDDGWQRPLLVQRPGRHVSV